MPGFSAQLRWGRYGLLIGLASVGTACAQPAAVPDAEPAIFRQVIPTPTGRNGYEDLVAAGEALRSSERFRNAERGGASLAEKRRVLADPPVARALALLRRALEQEIVPPAAFEVTDATFDRFGKLRSLARLLAMQQDVRLHDARVEEAVETARLGMRLGRAVETGPVITGLVGLAIRALPIRTFGQHLDRLSERDLDGLLKASQEWLAGPDLFPRVLAEERRFVRRHLPAELASSTEIHEQLDRLFDQVLAEWKKPAWKRSRLRAPEDGGAGERLAATLVAPLEQAIQSYTTEQARLRLLATHAAIRSFRLRHGRLPENLAILDLGDVPIDPFTGKPFRYTRQDGGSYRLTSAGPSARPGDPSAVGGRRPVSVTPGE